MTRISDRIAEEAQLLADEKWIIEALRKLKRQRNSLQVERLQLENLEATLRQRFNGRIPDDDQDQAEQLGQAQHNHQMPSTSNNVGVSQSNKAKNSSLQNKSKVNFKAKNNQNPGGSRNSIQFEDNDEKLEMEESQAKGPQAAKSLATEYLENIDLDSCNNEELDLSVSKSIFGSEMRTENLMEEQEEEDPENTVIDMNMFMFMNSNIPCEK